MKSLIRRLLDDEKGANAVEFALIAGPFLLLLLGTVEFARAYWDGQALQETAVAGARCMALPQASCSAGGAYDSQSTITFVTNMALDKGIALAAGDIAIDRNATCQGLSGFSQVEITYRFETALPDFLTALTGGRTLQADACFPNQS
jgi:Flp pilus assembly protein TadG